MRRAWLVFILLAPGCGKDRDTGLSYFSVDAGGLKVPQVQGWFRDRQAEVTDVDQGGVILRLVREHSVAGSPRIDVTITKKEDRPLSIDEFVTKNLREMTELEKNGSLRIASVDQRPMQIGPRRAYRVRHEYMVGGTVAITQNATLLVLDGRGVAVTAVGRTELYQPLAASIEVILAGLKTPAPAPGSEPALIPSPKGPTVIPSPVKPLTQPIDLGKVGGQK